MKNIAVLLHGSGVYDGTEIQEAVLSLLALAKAGYRYQCIAPDIAQKQVINHLNGEEQAESRNVLVESARIARGEILPLSDFQVGDYDALLMPGGFGTAKNLTDWAFKGPEASIQPAVKAMVLAFVQAVKPIVALCMSPTTVAKALEGSPYRAQLSVGSAAGASPYDIGAIAQGLEASGAEAVDCAADALAVDPVLKIISAPCYMMEADILQVNQNIEKAIRQLVAWL